jgi:hypothetical protein
MEPNKTDKNEHGIANFMALETAIANGEEGVVKELLDNQGMQELTNALTTSISLIPIFVLILFIRKVFIAI